MPTPRLYLGDAPNPFLNVPAELQSSTVELLFVTDREPERRDAEHRQLYFSACSDPEATDLRTYVCADCLSVCLNG